MDPVTPVYDLVTLERVEKPYQTLGTRITEGRLSVCIRVLLTEVFRYSSKSLWSFESCWAKLHTMLSFMFQNRKPSHILKLIFLVYSRQFICLVRVILVNTFRDQWVRTKGSCDIFQVQKFHYPIRSKFFPCCHLFRDYISRHPLGDNLFRIKDLVSPLFDFVRFTIRNPLYNLKKKWCSWY